MVFAIYALLEQLTPFQYDNLLFDSLYLKVSGGSTGFSPGAFLEYIDGIRLNDNFRIANILAPVFSLIIPHKLWFSLLFGIMVAATVWLICRLTSRDTTGAPLATAVWLGITLFLPWRNHLLIGDYALNYIFAGTLTLATLLAVTNRAYSTARRTSWGAVAIILPILLGAWHEGFALPLAAGFLLLAIVRRFRVPPIIPLAAILCAATAIAWIALSPGHLHRGAHETDFPAILQYPILSGINNCLTITLLTILAVSPFFRRSRRYLRQLAGNPVFVILTGAAIAGMTLSFTVKLSGARTAYMPQLCALAALIIWSQPIADRYMPRRISHALTVVTAVALVIHGIYCANWCYKLMAQHDTIITKIKNSATGQVYHDIIFPEEVSPLTLGVPSRTTFIEPFSYFVMDNRFATKLPAVIPSALNTDLTTANVTRFPSGVMRADDALFCSTPPPSLTAAEYGDRYGITLTDITFTDQSVRKKQKSFFIRFDDAAGNRYYYLKPYNTDVKQITDITLTN